MTPAISVLFDKGGGIVSSSLISSKGRFFPRFSVTEERAASGTGGSSKVRKLRQGGGNWFLPRLLVVGENPVNDGSQKPNESVSYVLRNRIHE